LRDWLLFEQWSPVTADGRTFGLGHVFDQAGALVASYAQDAMVRWLRDRPGQPPRTTS
jgi:acyl-CoA thioesterase-2